jgi:hypothetical protein
VAAIALVSASVARADTKSDCVAASDQGQQLRDDGKYQRAQAAFQVCANDACPKVVSRLCTQWLEELGRSMPTVVLGAKDEHGLDVVDARASLDGTPWVQKLDGKPVPIDPGEHILRVERDGSQPVEQRIVVRAGEKSRVVTIAFSPVAAPTEQTAAVDAGSRRSTPPSTARLVTTVALAALAVGAIGGGIYFGLQSNNEADSASSIRGTLPPNACANSSSAGAPSQACQNLADAVDAQNRDAVLNKVFYVAGAVLAVGAAVTWLLWPPPGHAKTVDTARVWFVPSVSPGGGGLSAAGSF